MADWPTADHLRRVLSVDFNYEDPYADVVVGVLESAIARVKADVGNWDEYADVRDDALAQAALRMAVLMVLSPEAATLAGTTDPTYQRHMFGHRRTFGVA